MDAIKTATAILAVALAREYHAGNWFALGCSFTRYVCTVLACGAEFAAELEIRAKLENAV